MSILFLRVFFTLSLASLGAFVPLLGRRLETLGLTGTELGVLLALVPMVRLLSAPLWGIAADRLALGGLLLRVGAALALLGTIVVWRASSSLGAAFGLMLFSVGRTPLGPLLDAFTLRALTDAGGDSRDYGRTRLWGSVGFLVAALVAGWVAATGGDPMVVAVALTGLCAVQSLGFPLAGRARAAPIWPALRAMADQPGLWALLAFGFCQALTVSVYDTFFSVHVAALGLPASTTGYAVAVGVAAEIAVMALGQPILARLGTRTALLLAAISGVPRWLLTAWLTDPVALVATQALHGTSFALFWIAGVQEISRRSAGVSASGQSLWSAATYGAGALVGAAGAGVVRELWGTAAIFQCCAALSTVSVLLAARSARPDAGVPAPGARATLDSGAPGAAAAPAASLAGGAPGVGPAES